MQHNLYPADWRIRAQACLERASYRCEHCGIRQGTLRVGKHHYNLYFVHLHAAHVNHDPHNPQAELRALCPACHMRHDRRTEYETQGRSLPKRRGYQSITLERVLHAARAAGLCISPDAESGTGVSWIIGDLSGTAVDVLEAISSALHCLSRERVEQEART